MSTIDSGPRASHPGGWSAARLTLPLAVLIVYLAIAFGRGEIYPVSPLGMFSEVQESSGRVLVRTSGGEVHEVSDFGGWRCEGSLDLRSAYPACFPDGYSAGAVIAGDHIASHPGAGEGERVELVRRVFRIPEPDGLVAIEDCPLASCTAVRGVGR